MTTQLNPVPPADELSNDAAVEQARASIELALKEQQLELPLLPRVASEVLTSSADERTDAEKLSNLIQQDQTLASHILKVVNSPVYRGATEIVALQQAIARLGLERIREIALTASLKGTLFKAGPYDALVQQAWKSSLATGLWAKEIARTRRKNVEVAYLCGLLNNVGVPVLLHHMANSATPLSAEQAQAVLWHCESAAGAALIEAWNLPQIVSDAIVYRSEFLIAPAAHDEIALTIAGLEFAIAMAAEDMQPDILLQLESIQFLNLYPEDVEALLLLEPVLQETLGAMCI